MAANAFHLLRQKTSMFSDFLLRRWGASQNAIAGVYRVPAGTRSGQAHLAAVISL